MPHSLHCPIPGGRVKQRWRVQSATRGSGGGRGARAGLSACPECLWPVRASAAASFLKHCRLLAAGCHVDTETHQAGPAPALADLTAQQRLWSEAGTRHSVDWVPGNCCLKPGGDMGGITCKVTGAEGPPPFVCAPSWPTAGAQRIVPQGLSCTEPSWLPSGPSRGWEGIWGGRGAHRVLSSHLFSGLQRPPLHPGLPPEHLRRGAGREPP